MNQIYHTMTEDGQKEVGIFTDGSFVEVRVDDEVVGKFYDPETTFDNIDYEYYVGFVDMWYGEHYM